MKLVLVGILLAALALCEGKTFTMCELVRELRRQGFPESQLRDWICLVDKESSFRTHVIGGPNSDGSRDHGLFQINDRWWCNNSNTAGKECNVTCAQLRTDDITRACTCARRIYNRHGFSAWYGWTNFCRGKPLPSISHC